jgi:ankyrin repeat protein
MELSRIDNLLFHAAITGNLPLLRHLLDNGANIDPEQCIRGCGYTPLTMAVMLGHVDVARELIARGANLDIMSGKPGEMRSIYDRAQNTARRNSRMDEIVYFIEHVKAAISAKLNVPSSGIHTISPTHNTDPITLNKIESGQEVYFFNNDPNPYSKNSAVRILNTQNPISPITRQPIVNIKRYTATFGEPNVKQNTDTVPSGGKRNARKRTTRKRSNPKRSNLKVKPSNRKRTTKR